MCPSTSPQWFRSVRFGSQPGDVFARRGEVLRIDPRRRAASLVGQSPPSLPPADGRTAGRRRLWRLEKPDRQPVTSLWRSTSHQPAPAPFFFRARRVIFPGMFNAKAYAAAGASAPLARTTIPRRDPTERDVQIEILFCGICHSDLHMVRGEWEGMGAHYPMVPGHEIVGRVTKVGAAVQKYKAGDLVGVGCMVDSDGTCPECKAGFENFCPNMTLTYAA